MAEQSQSQNNNNDSQPTTYGKDELNGLMEQGLVSFLDKKRTAKYPRLNKYTKIPSQTLSIFMNILNIRIIIIALIFAYKDLVQITIIVIRQNYSKI